MHTLYQSPRLKHQMEDYVVLRSIFVEFPLTMCDVFINWYHGVLPTDMKIAISNHNKRQMIYTARLSNVHTISLFYVVSLITICIVAYHLWMGFCVVKIGWYDSYLFQGGYHMTTWLIRHPIRWYGLENIFCSNACYREYNSSIYLIDQM